MPVVSTGQITITDVHDGLNLFLSNPVHVLPSNDQGVILPADYTNCVCTAYVMKGPQEVTGEWNITVAASAGIAGTYASNTYSVTALTADSAYVDFTATKSGEPTLTQRFSVARSKSAADGLSIIVSNESHVVASDSAGAVSGYTGSGTTIRVLEGSVELNAASSNSGNGSFTIGTPVVSPSGKITVGGRSYSSKTATVANHSAMAADTDSVTVTYPVNIRRANGTTVSLNKTQTITKSKQGGTGGTGGRGTVHVYAATAGTIWNDSEANAALAVAPHNGKIVADRVTLYNSTAGWTQTRVWSGSAWTVLGEVIDGSLLVTDSVTARAINTNDLFAQTITLPDNGIIRAGTTDYAELGGSSYFTAQAGTQTIFKIGKDGDHYIDGKAITNTLSWQAFDGGVIPYIREQLAISAPSGGGSGAGNAVCLNTGANILTSPAIPSAGSTSAVALICSYGGFQTWLILSYDLIAPVFNIQLKRVVNGGAGVNVGSPFTFTGSAVRGELHPNGWAEWHVKVPSFNINIYDATPGVGNIQYVAEIDLANVPASEYTVGTISLSASQAAVGNISGSVSWNSIPDKPNVSLVGHIHSAADITSGTLATARGGTGRTDGKVTALATARTLTLGSAGKSFDGSANVSWTLAEMGALAIGGAAGSITGFNNPTTAATANTIVYRDGSADISARLLRTDYADQASISGAMAFRINNGSDNYTRYCSNPSAVRAWLDANNASNLTVGTLPDGRLTGAYTGLTALTSERFIANSTTLPALQINSLYNVYAFGMGTTINANELILLATLDIPSNNSNYLLAGTINYQTSQSSGIVDFRLGVRSSTLPAKSLTLSVDTANQGRDLQLYVYNDTASNKVYICVSSTGSAQNVNGKIEMFSRGTYSTHLTVQNSKVVFDATGLTQVSATTTHTKSTSYNLTATSFTGAGTGLTALNASNIALGTLDDARLPTTFSQKAISKAVNTIGANDYHLELYSPDAGGGGDIALRFHQSGRWYYSIRANSTGFRLTGGGDNSLGNITAAAYYTGDNGGYVAGGGYGSSRVVSPYGFVDIGAQDAGYCHFVTDRPRYYFNRSIQVDGEFKIYNTGTGLNNNGLFFYNGETTLTSGNSGALIITGFDNDSALTLRTNGGSDRGHVYADSTNQIGFLDETGNWAFAVRKSSDRADFLVNNVFINGSKVVSLNDLVYGSAATQALASASMAQFKANKDAGLYNNYNVAEGAIAAGYINALFGQFNFLVANNANVTKLRANAIEVSGLGYALNTNPQFDGSAVGWSGALNTQVFPTILLSGSRVSAYFLELASGGQYVFGNQVPISAKEQYSISLWIVQHAGAGTNYLAVNFVDASGSTVIPTGGKWSVGNWAYWGLVNQAAPTDWTKMGIVIGGVDYPIPATAVSCSIGILANYNGAAANNLRIQDYRIEKAMGAVNIADGAITARQISADAIDGKTITGATFVAAGPNSDHFEVTRPEPFGGTSDLVNWFGPKVSGVTWNYSTNTPIYSGMTKANAKTYKTKHGDVYLNGTLIAGTIRNALRSTLLSAGFSVETGSFGSNGGAIVVVVSFSAASTTGLRTKNNPAAPTTPNPPTGTLYIDRKVNGNYVNVASQSITGIYRYSDEGAQYVVSWDLSGSFTYYDNDKNTAARDYRARVVHNTPIMVAPGSSDFDLAILTQE